MKTPIFFYNRGQARHTSHCLIYKLGRQAGGGGESFIFPGDQLSVQREAQSHCVGISSVSPIPVTFPHSHSFSGPLPSIFQDNFIFLANKDHL